MQIIEILTEHGTEHLMNILYLKYCVNRHRTLPYKGASATTLPGLKPLEFQHTQ